MKKYIKSLMLFLLALVAFSSCKVEEGENPGSDGYPCVTLYQFTPDEKQYNVDNDILVRIARNSVVDEVYYLAQKEEEQAAKFEELGEAGYQAYVVENGNKVELTSELNTDVVVTGLKGKYVVTVVGVAGGAMASAELSFMGIDWVNIGEGSYLCGPLKQEIPTPVLKAQHAEWYKLPGFKGLIIKIEDGNVLVESTHLLDHPLGPIYGNTLNGDPKGGYKDGSTINLFMFYFVPGVGELGTFQDVLQLPE